MMAFKQRSLELDFAVVELDVEALLALASQHAEDEGPEAELADLEMLARTCWSQLTKKQRAAALRESWASQPVELELMNGRPTADAGGVEWFITSAARHGELDDPDHQAGDLQDMIRALWTEMPLGGRRAVLFADPVSDMVAAAAGPVGLLGLDDDGPEDPSLEEWEAVLERFGLDDSFQYTGVQVADYCNAYRLEQAIRSGDAHTKHPMRRSDK